MGFAYGAGGNLGRDRWLAVRRQALNAGEQVSAAAGRLIRSGASIQTLLDELVDFNRTELGLGIKVIPSDVDLAVALS